MINQGADANNEADNVKTISALLSERAKQRFGIVRAGELQSDIEQTAMQLQRLCAEPLSTEDES